MGPSQTPRDHVAQIPNLIMYTSLNAAQNMSPRIKLELFFFFSTLGVGELTVLPVVNHPLLI